jgi:hypothetical protein
MTYSEFWVSVLNEHSTTQDNLRLGQRYFNRLAHCRPPIASALADSKRDPFYQSYVSQETHNWVYKLWDS